MDEAEKARLAAVYALDLLDTGPEERFDRITRLTKSYLGLPIAIVSLMDADRQWFKSVCGFDASETPRNLTFCDVTIRFGRPLIVNDATQDERFRGNPFVICDNGIRFYAGYPIVSSNQIVGTFCVADVAPRELTAEQVQAFMDLGAIAQDEIVKIAMATAAAATSAQLVAEQLRIERLVDEVAKRTMTQSLLADNEERLRRVLETSLDSFVCINELGEILEWNAAAEVTFGWRREEVIGRPLTDTIIPQRYQAAHTAGMERYLEHGTGPIIGKRIEVPARTKEGQELIVEMTVNDYELRGTRYIGAFLHDITERKDSQARLTESEDKLRTIADNLPVLIALLDKDYRYAFANPRFSDWFGVNHTELIGKSVSQAFGEQAFESWRPVFENALQGNVSEFESSITFGGRARVIQTMLFPRRNGAEINGMYVLATDVTQQRLHEQQLVELALSDALTGLPNRRSFDDALSQAIARASRRTTPLALAYLDIDRFKSINDTYGHAVGDEVLQELARRLKTAVRATDQVFRLAGDEFTILFEGIKAPAECSLVGEKILAAIRLPFRLSIGFRTISASVGITWSEDASPLESVLRKVADQALYQSKEQGRGRFTVLRVG